MRCASVMFSFELSSEGIRTFAKGPEGKGERGVLAMRLTLAFVNVVFFHCAKFEACCKREPGSVAHTLRLGHACGGPANMGIGEDTDSV